MTERHVCVLTTAHPTDDVRVNSRMVNAFLEAGYRVTWVGPKGAYFADQAGSDSGVRYHLFRPNSSKWRRLGASRAAARVAKEVVNVDWWYSPDPDAANVAIRMARRTGGRVLFDIHEVFHRGLLDRWFPGHAPGVVRELVRRRIARTCDHADLVTGVSDAVMVPYLRSEGPRVVTRNCAPSMFGRQAEEPGREHEGPLRVVHGKAIASNGTPQVLAALALLRGAAGHGVQVHFTRVGAGSFRDEFDSRIASLPHPSTAVVEDGVPHEEMPALLAKHHVGMVAYQRDLGVDSLPNRLFEYMASGLAILAPSYSAEIVAILEQEGIGITADFEDEREIAAALTWLSEHPAEVAEMGNRARAAFLSRYNWDSEAKRLLCLMAAMEAE